MKLIDQFMKKNKINLSANYLVVRKKFHVVIGKILFKPGEAICRLFTH